jgi:hypothetical protein
VLATSLPRADTAPARVRRGLGGATRRAPAQEPRGASSSSQEAALLIEG